MKINNNIFNQLTTEQLKQTNNDQTIAKKQPNNNQTTTTNWKKLIQT